MMEWPHAASDGIILLAHGTPDVLGEMHAYLKLVTGGRAYPRKLFMNCRSATRRTVYPTLRQAALLEERLGRKIYVGMRNWTPFILDVVEEMKRDGITKAKTICLAP
ncbi:ferrochelatase [Alloacidobacterium dinghuense]|uniref:Ferrochelatase n=1 Tax=Alloacidobacterium dinghuense TaxID=2763107 RepID=A0A7G8BM97_9BACT|nr:ferrochelatase [Alloacidobacterium dinghuense]QNI33667.1 ferrochelatase [Alloacidobacterium dinghuense]